MARALHAQNLALFAALPRISAVLDSEGRQLEPDTDWLCRYGDAWFAESGGEAKLFVTLETVTGEVSIEGGPANAASVTLVGDFSFSRGSGSRELLLTFGLAGLDSTIPLDLGSIEIKGLALSFPAADPAVAKALPDGSVAIGLVLDAEFDIEPLEGGEDAEARWIHTQRSRLSVGPRGSGGFAGWPTLQPPATDLSKFAAFDVDLLDLDQNYVIDWAVAFDDWVIDAVIRLNVVAIKDQVRLRLWLRDTSPERLRLGGDGSGVWCDDWWDIGVRADATLGFSGRGGIEATYEITRATADTCDKDLLSALQDSGVHRGRLAVDLPTRVSPASSPLGAMAVNTLGLGSGWVGVGGGPGISAIDPPQLEIDDELIVARPLPGHSVRGQLWVGNRSAPGRTQRLPLQIGVIRIEGNDAARFSVDPVGADDPQPRVAPGEQTSFHIAIDRNDELNHEVTAAVLTTGGRRDVPVRFLLAPSSLSAEVRRGGTVVRELGCGSDASVPTERSAASFTVTISNAGPGATSLARLSFPSLSHGAWWVIAMDVNGENQPLNKSGDVWRPPAGPPVLAPGGVVSIYIGAAEAAADGPPDATTPSGPHSNDGELTATLRMRYSDGDFDVPIGAGSLEADIGVGDDLVGNFGVDGDHICAELAGLREREEIAQLGGGLEAIVDALQTSCCPPPSPPSCTCIDFLEMESRDALEGVLTLEAGGRDVFEYQFGSDPERLFMPWPGGDTRVALQRSSSTSERPVRMKITRWTASRERVIPSDTAIDRIELTPNGELSLHGEGSVATHQLWGTPDATARDRAMASGPTARRAPPFDRDSFAIGDNRITASTSDLHLHDATGRQRHRLQLARPIVGLTPIRGGLVTWDAEGLSVIRQVRGRLVLRGTTAIAEPRGILVAGNTLFALGKTGASTVFRLGYRDIRAAGRFVVPPQWAKMLPRGAVRTMGLWAAAVSEDGRSVSVWRLRRGRRKQGRV